MGLHEALFTRLGAVTPYTALVAARTYRDHAPQAPTAPFVVIEIDDDEDAAHAMGVDASIRRASARFYCISATGDGAGAVAAALIAGLRRYSGTAASVVIDDCYIRGNRALVDDETKLIGRLVEFEICYQG